MTLTDLLDAVGPAAIGAGLLKIGRIVARLEQIERRLADLGAEVESSAERRRAVVAHLDMRVSSLETWRAATLRDTQPSLRTGGGE